MRNHHRAAYPGPTARRTNKPQWSSRSGRSPMTTGASGDDRPLDGVADPVALPMTRHSSASQRFQRALASGNPRLVRAAAAELPAVGIAEAAAIVLVIERTEPENHERTALRWLAKLTTAGQHVDLSGVAHAATALEALPHELGARATLAEICRTAGLPEAAPVFAVDHRRSVYPGLAPPRLLQTVIAGA
jgi:hypothetical protein